MNNIEFNRKYILNVELLYKTNKYIPKQNIDGTIIQKISNNAIVFKSTEDKYFDSLYGKLITLETNEFEYIKLENISANLFLIQSECENEIVNVISNVGIFLIHNNKKSLFVVFKGFIQLEQGENKSSNICQLSISEPFDFIVENKTTLSGRIVKDFSANCVLFESDKNESFRINNETINCKFFLLTARYSKENIKHFYKYDGIVNIGILKINDFNNETKEDLEKNIYCTLIGSIKQNID